MNKWPKHPYGQQHPAAKLTDEQIDQIRDLREQSGHTYVVIAKLFNTSKATIAAICQYRRRCRPS